MSQSHRFQNIPDGLSGPNSMSVIALIGWSLSEHSSTATLLNHCSCPSSHPGPWTCSKKFSLVGHETHLLNKMSLLVLFCFYMDSLILQTFAVSVREYMISVLAFPPACPPACLPICLPAYLPACLPAYLPACLPACLPARLPACPPA